MSEPISTSVAAKLASAAVGAGLSPAKRRLLGSEEERAVRRVFKTAFVRVFDGLVDENVGRLVVEQLEILVADPVAASTLVDVALHRREPDIDLLRGRFSAVGLSAETFAIDFDVVMTRLCVELTIAMRAEAESPQSPLFNLNTLAQFDLLIERLEVLERFMRSPRRVRGSGGVPPVPEMLIGREKALGDITQRLNQGLTIVRGWPGVGKTSLMTTLANDPSIEARFPDGVLWAALGQADRVALELRAWARELDFVTSPGVSVAELSDRVRSLLRQQRVLLIVDDVWTVEDAVPFCVGGPRCATLVTTRRREVAEALAPSPEGVYVLDVLPEDESLHLLGLLAPTVVTEHRDDAAALVSELEGLPLALRVAGRLLSSESQFGWGIADLLADIRHGAKLLEAAAPSDRAELSNHTIPTVAALLRRSTDLLDSEDRLRFAYLGAFAPKPAQFDASDLAVVWDVEDPRPTLRRLAGHGLIEPIGNGVLQMHALLVMHATSLLAAA